MLWIIIRKAALVAVFNVLAVLIAALIAAYLDKNGEWAVNVFVLSFSTIVLCELVATEYARKA